MGRPVIEVGNANGALIYILIHNGQGEIWNENRLNGEGEPEPGFVPKADAVRIDCAIHTAPSGLSQIWQVEVPLELPDGMYWFTGWVMEFGFDPAASDELLNPPSGASFCLYGGQIVSVADVLSLLAVQGTGDGVSSPSPGAV